MITDQCNYRDENIHIVCHLKYHIKDTQHFTDIQFKEVNNRTICTTLIVSLIINYFLEREDTIIQTKLCY